jgi:hypothetical protein
MKLKQLQSALSAVLKGLSVSMIIDAPDRRHIVLCKTE